MLNFSRYLKQELLIEGRGEETAHSGFANEHFTDQHIKNYVASANRGGHEGGMRKINSSIFNPKSYDKNHPIQKAIRSMGAEEVARIHEDSKNTAHAIINHLRNGYGLSTTDSHHVGKVGQAGAEEVKKLTDKSSNADIVVSTKNLKGKRGFALAQLEHVGASLKYSKKSSSATKIHSPSITHMGEIVDAHHEQMHGKKMGVVDNMNKAVKKGLRAQQDVIKTHAEELAKHFSSREFQRELKDPKKAKKYAKLLKSGTLENLKSGQLSSAGVSYIRNSDKFKHIYAKMSQANLKMKSEVAAHLYAGVAAVLGGKSESKKHAEIKESLIRSMGNIHKAGSDDALPTFLVSTHRGKETEIHDVTKHFQKHFEEKGVDNNISMSKGTSLFKAGPMTVTIDARPATRGNPLNGPANASVPTNELKRTSNSSKKGSEIKNKLKENFQLLERRISRAESQAAALDRSRIASDLAAKGRQIKAKDYSADVQKSNETESRRNDQYWRISRSIQRQSRAPMREEAPANAMGTAGISGLDSAVNVGIAGRDTLLSPTPLRRKPPKMFGGKAVFTVPSSDYYKATLGRKKNQHWRSMVAGPLGEEIRQYALDNKDAPIIVEDETTGAMMYLRYGKR